MRRPRYFVPIVEYKGPGEILPEVWPIYADNPDQASRMIRTLILDRAQDIADNPSLTLAIYNIGEQVSLQDLKRGYWVIGKPTK